MTRITYKTLLKSGKPYSSMDTDEYLSYLSSRRDQLYRGDLGVYLGRRINVNGQELYFPFLDIDGSPNSEGHERIATAIVNCAITVVTLKKLNVHEYFTVVATGGTGLRMMSNILLDYETYQAFIDFLRCEMPHIWDLNPTIDVSMPHQMFAYKGHEYQNRKVQVDRHSVIVSPDAFLNGAMSAQDYETITNGKPDPDTIIEFLKRFFNFVPITDLNVLGDFGKKLHQYKETLKDIQVAPFRYLSFRKKIEPISLKVMQEMLRDRNIISKIQKRGQNLAISFQGWRCPMCQKTSSNARAYPPHYKLYCFNTNCEAHDGVPLVEWSGIKGTGEEDYNHTHNSVIPKIPSKFQTLSDARDLVKAELCNPDDDLILATPGVGKSHVTLEYLATSVTHEFVLYSCYNRQLQREAYDKIKTFTKDHHRVHLLQPREDLCLRIDELAQVTSRGFSPSEVLCCRCEHREICPYYKQRETIESGIVFVTHHMLQYLEGRFPNPDLIVLDENLLGGFRLEDQCSERQTRALATVLSGIDYLPVKQILDLAQRVATQVMMEQSHPVIINGRKLTGSNVTEDSVLGLLAKQNQITEDDIKAKIESTVAKIDEHSRINLYRTGVDLKALNWLKGLISPSRYSYLFITAKGDIFFKVKYVTPLGYKNTPIKILDATGHERVASVLTNRKVKPVRIDVQWSSHRVHIQTNTSRGVLKYARDDDLRKLLSIMIREITATKVMVITYKFLKQRLLDLCKKVDPSKVYTDYHFIGPRGVNEFEECDAVLVLGLPFPNLNSSAQDACILFPKDEDSDLRNSWVTSTMLWELIQNIHRIRPVNKTSVEIVIAANYWPPVFPEPDKVIDKSRSANTKEVAIQRLEPFVKELGFLNPDIGFIAGVFPKTKERISNNFRRKIHDVVRANILAITSDNSNFQFSQFLSGEDCHTDFNFTIDHYFLTNEAHKLRSNLILVIKYIYYVNLIRNDNILPLRLANLVMKEINDFAGVPSHNINPSNTNQWAELLIDFKKKYPHFESFKLKLPHSKGSFVKGVGDKQRVLEFYEQLNNFDVFGKINLESYTTIGESLTSISPIPDEFAVCYVPAKKTNVVYLGLKDQLTTISLTGDSTSVQQAFGKLTDADATKIITNDGKWLAKQFILSGIKACDIHDLALNEKIIRNGKQLPGKICANYLLKQYDLGKHADVTMCVSQLYGVWELQQKLIQEMGLANIVELERRIIWITAKMELVGIGIDVVGILEFEESVEKRLRDVEDKLRTLLPENLSVSHSQDLKTYLNKKFKLNLAKVDRDSLSSVENPEAQAIINLIVEYRQLKKECDDIEKYLCAVGDDYRVRDEIDQLRTSTGRFYRLLHTVKKTGPMRSFFQPRKGYKLILADYSQQEARIIAGLANDKRAIEVFKKDGDIYLETAADITGKPVRQCSEFRKIAKTIVLGLNYGRSEYSIYEELASRMGLSVTLDDVRQFIARYFAAHPEILRWTQATVAEARKCGVVKTILGRHKSVSDEVGDNSIYNFPVQGTGTDAFKLALIWLDKELGSLDARVIHILHDEIIVEARGDIADKVAQLVKQCMEEAFLKLIPNVPFKVVPKIQDNWGTP